MHKVFCYGTLKPKEEDTHTVKGRMWSVGPFPCVILGGSKDIPGQIIQVTDKEVEALDRYEGVPHMYTREKTTAYGKDGQEEVWIYEWANDVNDFKEIDKWDNNVR